MEQIAIQEFQNRLIRPTSRVDIIEREALKCKLLDNINKKFGGLFSKVIFSREDLETKVDDKLCIAAFGKKLNLKQILNQIGFDLKSSGQKRKRKKMSTKCDLPTQKQLKTKKRRIEFISKYNGPISAKAAEQKKWAKIKLAELKKLHALNKKSDKQKTSTEVGSFKSNSTLRKVFESIHMNTINDDIHQMDLEPQSMNNVCHMLD